MLKRMFLVALLVLLGTSLAHAQPAQIWKTGQTTHYSSGDDGALQKGVAWPSPRFKDNGDAKTVTDKLTGLMWTKDANAPGPDECTTGTTMSWQAALNYVACLNKKSYLGHGDWRLPNRKELHSLTDFSQYNPALPSDNPFTNVQHYYWSSTTDAGDKSRVWYFDMSDGFVGTDLKTGNNSVWPVRAGNR